MWADQFPAYAFALKFNLSNRSIFAKKYWCFALIELKECCREGGFDQAFCPGRPDFE